MIVQWYKGRDGESTNVQLPDIAGSMLTMDSTLEIHVDPDGNARESSEVSPTPDIEILEVISFNDQLASDETVETFTLRIGECSGLLRATMKVTTLKIPGEIKTLNPKGWVSKEGAVAVLTAGEELHS